MTRKVFVVGVGMTKFEKPGSRDWDYHDMVREAGTTDTQVTFDKSCINIAGAGMTRRAALRAYEESGLGSEDAQVIELHDCFSASELVTYEALGLCEEGTAGVLVDEEAIQHNIGLGGAAVVTVHRAPATAA